MLFINRRSGYKKWLLINYSCQSHVTVWYTGARPLHLHWLWSCFSHTCSVEASVVRLYLPVERYGQYADKTNNQLKMNPVVHQVSQQCVEARSHRPEVLDYCTGERAISRGKQLTRHYETWQNDSLKTNRDGLRWLVSYRLKTSNVFCLFRL